jgi:hypothetical protein
MGSKILAAAFGILSLGLFGFAVTTTPTDLQPQVPSVRWLNGQADPAKPEPAKVEPSKPEAAKVEPAKVEPSKPEAAKPEPAKVEPSKPEAVKVEPAKPEPAKPEVAKAEPAKPEAAKVEPTKPAAAAPAKAVAAVQPAPKPAPKPAKSEEEGGIGTLSVNSNMAGASVFLDGAAVGQTPIEIDVPSGSHKVKVVHPTDGTEKKQTVAIKPGGTSQVEVNF